MKLELISFFFSFMFGHLSEDWLTVRPFLVLSDKEEPGGLGN